MKLLFDFGGVIVDLKKEACIAAFDCLGFDIRPYLGTYVQGGVFASLERGQLSLSDFCHEIRKIAQQPALTDAQIVAAWEAYLVGIPEERLQLLLNIHQHYYTCVLSNTNVVHWQQGLRDLFSWKGHTIGDYFDQTFLSYELQLLKPEPAIFEAVVERMGGKADEIIFFDDSEANCAAARASGLQAVLAPEHGAWMPLFEANGKLRYDRL